MKRLAKALRGRGRTAPDRVLARLKQVAVIVLQIVRIVLALAGGILAIVGIIAKLS